MGVRNSLHHQADRLSIRQRLNLLSTTSDRRWGKMNPAQMMNHCTKILQVSTGKVILPNPNFIFKAIGMMTKFEMWWFNNGIPRNMPTFDAVLCDEDCDFFDTKKKLFCEIDHYLEIYECKKLPRSHPLFGKMSEEQWGFMQYKHLDHHLKQFGI